ncbi:MAG: hypothetical protein HF967_09040 [Methanosarcinales archaeon]|nr:hypothetical protein [Methanosarcinales archaeon]
MESQITYFVEVLESLLNDLNSKSKEELEKIIKKLQIQELNQSDLIKIQEDLEQFTVMYKMDSYTRTEIMNIITELEQIM